MPDCCPAAHAHRACSDPVRCSGFVGRAALLLARRGLEAPEVAEQIRALAAAERFPEAGVRRRVETALQELTCPPHCSCACHACDDECPEHRFRARARPHGPFSGLAAARPHVLLRAGGDDLMVTECARLAKRLRTDQPVPGTTPLALPDDVVPVGRAARPVPPLRSVAIGTHYVEGEPAFGDRLVVDSAGRASILAAGHLFALPTSALSAARPPHASFYGLLVHRACSEQPYRTLPSDGGEAISKGSKEDQAGDEETESESSEDSESEEGDKDYLPPPPASSCVVTAILRQSVCDAHPLLALLNRLAARPAARYDEHDLHQKLRDHGVLACTVAPSPCAWHSQALLCTVYYAHRSRRQQEELKRHREDDVLVRNVAAVARRLDAQGRTQALADLARSTMCRRA